MPDAYEDDEGFLLKDKRMGAALKRYEEEKKQVTEQEQWELDQQKKASFSVKKTVEQKKYELLIENQVDFIQSSIIAGIQDAGKLKEKLSKKKKRKEDELSSSDSDINEVDLKEAEKMLSP